MAMNFKEHIISYNMSMEFELMKFWSANIKLSDIPQSLLYTNVAGNFPVHLRSTAQFILFSQMLYHDFSSSDAR